MGVVYSVNGVPIRLTEERWGHIVKVRDYMAEYYEDCLQVLENPDLVIPGTRGSCKAVKGYGRNWYLVVIYKEVSRNDGFVITAFFSRKIDKRRVLWRR